MRPKTYVKWDGELVAKATDLLKKHGLVIAAHKLGTTPESMRRALRLRGIHARVRAKQKKAKAKRPGRAFVQPQDNPMRPFAAMAAMEADTGGCRFPLGDLDKDNFRFCGSPKTTGSYCEAHHAKMRIPNSAGWSKAAFDAWAGFTWLTAPSTADEIQAEDASEIAELSTISLAKKFDQHIIEGRKADDL